MLIILNSEKKIIGLNLYPRYKKNLKNLEDFFKIIKNINNYILENNIELKEISVIKEHTIDNKNKFFIANINKEILDKFFIIDNLNKNINKEENKNEEKYIHNEISFEINEYEYKDENFEKEEIKDLKVNFIVNENFEHSFWN